VASRDVVEAALEDALHRRLVSASWVERSARRAGRRSATLLSLLAERAPGQAATESTLEDSIVRLLRGAGRPPPVRQYRLPGRSERIDLAYPEAKLAIEAQSMAWHAEPRRSAAGLRQAQPAHAARGAC